MSEYLITQVTATANIDVRVHTRVVDGRGEPRLQALTVQDVRTGQREEVAAAAVFILIGAEPHTGWLRDVAELDDRGFVLTGSDVSPRAWPLPRAPLPFETSVPGVFAVGRRAARLGQTGRRARWGKGRSRWARSITISKRQQTATPTAGSSATLAGSRR